MMQMGWGAGGGGLGGGRLGGGGGGAGDGGGGGGGGGGGAEARVELARLQQLYSAQLQTLAEMGFFDAEANLRALVATGGNVQAAIERLLR